MAAEQPQASSAELDGQNQFADVPAPGTPPENERLATVEPERYDIVSPTAGVIAEGTTHAPEASLLTLDLAIADVLNTTRIGPQRELSASVASAVEERAAGLAATAITRSTGTEQR